MNEISIFLNGETKHLLAKSVNELLLQEGIDPTARGIAVAINDIIALKDSWNENHPMFLSRCQKSCSHFGKKQHTFAEI